MKKKIIFLGFCMVMGFSLSTAVKAEAFHAVIFNDVKIGKGGVYAYPGFSLKQFGIVEHKYWNLDAETKIENNKEISKELKKKYKNICRPLDKSFIDNLKKSKFLYIGQGSGGASWPLFKSENAEAVKEFLKNGGVLFFDYNASASPDSFLNSISVKKPLYGTPGYCTPAIYFKDREHILVNKPNKISDELKKGSAHGCWGKWSDKQAALFRNLCYLEVSAAMIVQKNVLGKGTIIFNQIFTIFRNLKGEHGKLVENILTYAYGSQFYESYKKSKPLK